MCFENNYCDDEILDIRKARERNLKINIAKVMIIKSIKKDKKFSKEDLKEFFNMKESDIVYIVADLFNNNDGLYYVKNNFSDFLDKVFASNSASNEILAPAETQFLKIYGRFRKELEKDYRDSKIFNYY